MGLLPLLGAEPVEERVVIDRNRITGDGVTAGIDFGLTVASQLWGVEMAQMLQLGTEYNPQSPFRTGSPHTAPPELVGRFKKITAKSAGENEAAALKAASIFK